MKRKRLPDLPPLDPEVKEAWLRVLEKSFGEFAVKGGGTPTELSETIDKNLLTTNPELKDRPGDILNKRRSMMARFFEIVANEPKTPRGKKYDQIIKNFMDESVEKYRAEHPEDY